MKTDFSKKRHLLKVIQSQTCYRVTGKPIKHSTALHNNIGFNSIGFEDMATEITKKSLTLTTRCRLRPIAAELPRISGRALYRLQVVYIFASDRVRLSSFKFPWWTCAVECGTAVQRHPRSLIFVAIEKAYKTLYQWLIVLIVINSNLGSIWHRFRDTTSYWLKIANFPYPSLVYRPLSG